MSVDRPTSSPARSGKAAAARLAELAHRIRHPLAGIRSAVQLVRDRLQPRSWEHEVLGQALEAFDRVEGEVQALLADPDEPAK